MPSKRKFNSNKTLEALNEEGIDLFVDKPPDRGETGENESSDDTDSSDSESSDSDSSELEDEEEPDSSDDDSSELEDFDEAKNSEDDDANNNVPSVGSNKTKTSKAKTAPTADKADAVKLAPPIVDEYQEDSSDEEDIRNTVGNIPMEWYKNMAHIGYDVEGRKLIKPQQGDQLDDFLDKVDDPNYWRTVTNKLTGQRVVLSKDDLSLIHNLQKKKHPTMSTDEAYAPWIETFVNEVMIHPLSNRPEHKRSFIPSKWEKLKVGQMVHALKMGWMKPTVKDEDKDEDDENRDTQNFYMLWKEDEESEISKRHKQHIPAPKLQLPGHAESYNPPPEYLFTKEEEEKWREQEPEERRINFIPQKFSNLRSVPGFPKFIQERFERCLDLYLCPRQRKMRMNVDPEDLIPKLPKPRDLQPFPTTQSLEYLGHTDLVRTISVDPSGQWLVSGSDDSTVCVWEVATGRCVKKLVVKGTVKCVAWNPNPAVCLVVCAVDQSVILLNPGVGDKLQVANTDSMLKSHEDTGESSDGKQVSWQVYDGKDYEDGLRLELPHGQEVTQVTWHGKGDYFAAVMPQGQSRSVLIHQLSRRRSQNPFSKARGLVQCVRFHPLRPFLFVATQRYVRVYNLLKQELSKKLLSNCKWISSMAVHPEGDNVITGSYDTRLGWFDLDLSTKPYQTLKHHKKAIRQVCYHKNYPLFASASDDCSVIVCHGMVYNDLLQNPLIVPVKILRGHSQEKGVGVLDCVFHPTQPWIFSAGADGTIRLYT